MKVPLTPGDTVKVAALMVATFMASLKVAVTIALGHTSAGSVGRGDGDDGGGRVASIGGGGEGPHEIAGQGIAEQIADSGGEGGGVEGASGERAGGSEGKDGAGGIVGEGSAHARRHGEGGGVDSGHVHGFTECGGDHSVGARPQGTSRWGDGDHGRRGQIWVPETIGIAASRHENDHQECCEPRLISVLFTHQPCLSSLHRCLEDFGSGPLFECAAQPATNTSGIGRIGRTIGRFWFRNGKPGFVGGCVVCKQNRKA